MTMITYVNQSQDTSWQTLVFEQPSGQGVIVPLAWLLLPNDQQGARTSFEYQATQQIAAYLSDDQDSSALIDAEAGQRYRFRQQGWSGTLEPSGAANDAHAIEVINESHTTINLLLFRDGVPSAIYQAVEPGMPASFEPPQSLFWAVVPPFEAGTMLSAAMIERALIKTDLANRATLTVTLLGNPSTGYLFRVS